MISVKEPLDLTDPDAARFLGNLQGNILKAHGRPHSLLLFLRFNPDRPDTYGQAGSARSDVYGAARAALVRSAQQYATPASKQLQDSQDRKIAIMAGKAPSEDVFGMVLLTLRGYEVLLTDQNDWPRDGAFRQGMHSTDKLYVQEDQWEQSYKGEIHAMILLAHEDANELQKLEQRIKAETVDGFDIFPVEYGHKLTRPGQNEPIEHFGFADGLSNPILIKQDLADNYSKWDPAAPLDLVLVEEWRQNPKNPATYGSYMVFYKLEQNVPLFRQLHRTTGHQVIGRQPDGTPLLSSEGGGLNNFNYEGDPNGSACPVTAHIRKMNDRTQAARGVRVVRRGMTYRQQRQDPQGEEGASPQERVGLLFMSFQADIARQFEALQQQATAQGPADALLGSTGGVELVKPRGGEYFYAPSLPFLRELATLRPEQAAKFSKAWAALLNDDELLKRFGEQWNKSPVDAARLFLGVERNDFATLYASYLKASRENMKKIRQGREKLERGPSHIQQPLERDKLNQALNLLLDPATLERFLMLWPDDPEAALQLVHLSRQHMLDFYAHLRKQQVRLEWPLWL